MKIHSPKRSIRLATVADVDDRVEKLAVMTATEFAEAHKEFEEVHKEFAEVHEKIDGLRQELRAEVGGLRKEMHEEFADFRKEMREGFQEMRREFRAIHETLKPVQETIANHSVAIADLRLKHS